MNRSETRRAAARPSRFLVATLLWLASAAGARAWIYSEHRAITARGIEGLDPRHRGELGALWSAARSGHEARLCAKAAEGDAADAAACLDLAAWPAIAGDHSCSPQGLLATVLDSDWILDVAKVADRAARKMASARNDAERRNAQTTADIALERADRDYSTRAGSNNVHFLLPRTGRDAAEYALACLRPGAEPNAIATYVLFHLAALARAADAENGASAADRAAAVRDILALESFAIHFLEDAFAAGHIAGTWGNVAERKGTHDYYNEHGLDTEDWKKEDMTLFGDGHLQAADLERAGEAVRTSLVQVLDAGRPGTEIREIARPLHPPPDVASGAYDAGRATGVPEWIFGRSVVPPLAEVLAETPVPFRGPGAASLPRFRAEIGSFIGLASGVGGAGTGGGFTTGTAAGLQGNLDVGLRFGVGLEGLLGDTGDGVVFLQGGLVNQSRSGGTCGAACASDPLLEQFVPGVPARSGLNFRFRIPFWLIPGDLLLATPLLAFTDVTALKKMGIQATDGGLLTLQRKLATPIGRVQFVVGREVSATLFGFGTKDAFLAIEDTPAGRRLVPVAVKSIQWEFPVFEYRPFREYGTRYVFSALMQIGGGFDQPISSVVVGQPTAAPPPLRTRYFGFVRIFFDGRRYF